MAQASNNIKPECPENIVCTPTFVFPAAFPGIDPRQHIANFVHHVPVSTSVSNQQQVNNTSMIHTTAPKLEPNQAQDQQHNVKIKQARNNHTQQSPLIQQQQPIAPHLLTTAIAFPSNPLNQHQQQQHLQPQHLQQHQSATIIIPAPTTSSSSARNTITTYNNNNTSLAVTWTCPSCKIPFKSASELQTHLSIHTKVEKSSPCQQCGKLFASAERVRIHIRVAHGEKSCACEICGSGFSYRCKLLDHMRTHTGDKPFQCDSCGRSFSQKNHLRRHQMIHTGERPFPCDICGRGFYRKDKLSRHRKIHLNPGGSSRGRGASVINNSAITNNVTIAGAVTSPQHIVTSIAPSSATIHLLPVHLDTHLAHQQWIATQHSNPSASQTNINTTSNDNSPSAPPTPTTTAS